MAITEETPARGEQRTENVGRIEEIQGVVIEAVFPDKLPEINHAIKVRRPEEARAEEDEDIAASADEWLVCEIQQHLGDDRVRAVALDTTDGLSRGAEVIDTGAPITVHTAYAVPNGSERNASAINPKLSAIATSVATLGQKRVSPSEYFRPSAQAISSRPAPRSAIHALTVVSVPASVRRSSKLRPTSPCVVRATGM